MKETKQAQELAQTIERINAYYDDMVGHIQLLFNTPILRDELLKVSDKAKAWDIFKAKCAKGAKVGASNLSKKERIDRAKHASDAKKLKAEKEKERKRLNQIAKHRR